MEFRKAKEQDKVYSFVVCFLLNNLGYNEDIRRFRESYFEVRSNFSSNMASNFALQMGIDLSVRCIETGSKPEGASLPLQGDFDMIKMFEDILCAEDSSGITHFSTLKPVYSEKVPPGYVRVTKGHLDDTPMGMLCEDSYLNLTLDGLPYISSTILHNFCKQCHAAFARPFFEDSEMSEELSFSGPACTNTMKIFDSVIGVDEVFGIYFYSPIYLPRWAARRRHYCWPSSDVINDISSMEGYIVPVGSIEGENPDLDWRISYVTAENKLISNLNTIQFKLYIVMKMIAKELIYPDFPVISSYVVKNIVLWVCELNPQSLFTADLLLDQIRKCLQFIRSCLHNNHLPNYIIPERNLIALRIDVLSKRLLILRVNNLLNDGRAIFCRLSIFKKHSPLSLVLAPSSVYYFGKTRDKVEKLFYLEGLLSKKIMTPGEVTRLLSINDDLILKAVSEGLVNSILVVLLFPDIHSIQSETQICDMYSSRLKLFLS